MKAEEPTKAFGAVIGKALKSVPAAKRSYPDPDILAVMTFPLGMS